MRFAPSLTGLIVTVSIPLAAQLAPLSITTSSLPFGGVNQGYNARLQATGGSGDFSWAIVSGSLPPGVGLNSDVPGQIVGAPTAGGAFNFTAQVTDLQTMSTASKQFVIDVMQISNSSQLPGGSTCSSYSVTFAVSDGPPPPFTWSIDTPPPGLLLNSSTGVLSGTPTSGGPFSFNIMATASGGITATKAFLLTVSSVCFLTTSLPDGDLNSFYRQSLILSGGRAPFKWILESGSLPTGVNLSPTSGLLSGTPTVLGPFTFSVTVTDSNNQSATQSFTVTINPALAFSTTSPLPPGMPGTNYSQTFAATGGSPPYTFSCPTPPTGLTMTPAGVLSGTPSPGNYNFPVTVTDAAGISVMADFQLSVALPGPVLQVSPSALTFNAAFEGDAPAPQSIEVTPVGTSPVTFQVATDGGVGVPAPSWISVSATDPTAPSRIVVHVNQGTLAAQSSTARVVITDPNGNQIAVNVTLNISSSPAQFQVSPDTLHFAARVDSPGTLVATLGVRNAGGGGPISFSTAVQGNSTWISGVSPASGVTVANSIVFLKVSVNTQGLNVGAYHDVIVFTAGSVTVKVPVALFLSSSGAILGLNVTGIRFQARQGGGYTTKQTVDVLDFGDPTSSLAWTAQFVSGSQFFTAGPSSGNATPSTPGIITVAPTASALQMNPGGYYGLLKISSAQAQNSPLYVVLVLDLANDSSLPLPDPSPAGLVFIGPAGQPITASQTINVNTSTATAASFQVSVATANGGNWLTATPASGSSTGSTPGQITVSADATSLSPGIYSGEVDISMSGALRSVIITLIVQPANAVARQAANLKPHATESCTPAALAITPTSLADNFSQPAGWPTPLSVQLNDDCGNPVSSASVTASFSDGDPSLMLREGPTASYSATWQPGVAASSITITIQGQAAQLKPATAQLIGGVNPNQSAPPFINENGTVNIYNAVSAGALAPSMIVEVFGTGLSTAKGNPGVLPLPSSFQGTSLIVGAYQAPLYFVSADQLDAQIAAELQPNQQYPLIASLNNALSVPVMVDIAAYQLGIAANADGTAIAQHGANSAYVTAASPAKPGEVLVIYLSGMGATNPAVKSGEAAPGTEPLARVTNEPTVTVDGQNATVQFAGLTPGLVGLYQVNFVVPASATTGDLTLIVSQNGVLSNATRIPVSK